MTPEKQPGYLTRPARRTRRRTLDRPNRARPPTTETPLPAQCWLELHKTPGNALEERLSRLCYQVQTLEQQGVRYGLLLGQQSIPPGEGSMHQTACLTALALYENN